MGEVSAQEAVLTLNAGSSSLKFGVFTLDGTHPRRRWSGEYRGVGGRRVGFRLRGADGGEAAEETVEVADHEQALSHLLGWWDGAVPDLWLVAAGHRVVHGGTDFDGPVPLDGRALRRLGELVHLAPLHMPHNLAIAHLLQRLRPGLFQVACFDTAFHRTMPLRERCFALPRRWFGRGVQRYGFHGLSYEYIASVLPDYLGERADGRVIVAHLGHGASLCALHRRRSVATTMGMTPLDGIPMATRPGALDPGVVLWLQQHAGMAPEEVETLLNRRSGLLGLSGISGDMETLLADRRPEAGEAVDYFVHHTHRAIASLAASLGGLDALVFTGGIGENAPYVRERICREAAWLGVTLDAEANNANGTCISLPHGGVSVWRIPTDEEQVIARHTLHLLQRTG